MDHICQIWSVYRSFFRQVKQYRTNAFIRDGDKVFRTYFIDARGNEQMETGRPLN
jgi:predicted dithiol-disulfide oxidoreductase (DUF899 family)